MHRKALVLGLLSLLVSTLLILAEMETGITSLGDFAVATLALGFLLVVYSFVIDWYRTTNASPSMANDSVWGTA